jgi:hypothetical protein
MVAADEAEYSRRRDEAGSAGTKRGKPCWRLAHAAAAGRPMAMSPGTGEAARCDEHAGEQTDSRQPLARALVRVRDELEGHRGEEMAAAERRDSRGDADRQAQHSCPATRLAAMTKPQPTRGPRLLTKP